MGAGRACAPPSSTSRTSCASTARTLPSRTTSPRHRPCSGSPCWSLYSSFQTRAIHSPCRFLFIGKFTCVCVCVRPFPNGSILDLVRKLTNCGAINGDRSSKTFLNSCSRACIWTSASASTPGSATPSRNPPTAWPVKSQIITSLPFFKMAPNNLGLHPADGLARTVHPNTCPARISTRCCCPLSHGGGNIPRIGFRLRSDQLLCYFGRFGMVPTGGCVAMPVHHHHRLVDAARLLPDAVLPVHGCQRRPHPTTRGPLQNGKCWSEHQLC